MYVHMQGRKPKRVLLSRSYWSRKYTNENTWQTKPSYTLTKKFEHLVKCFLNAFGKIHTKNLQLQQWTSNNC